MRPFPAVFAVYSFSLTVGACAAKDYEQTNCSAACSPAFNAEVDTSESLESIAAGTMTFCLNATCYSSPLTALASGAGVQFPDDRTREAMHTPLITVIPNASRLVDAGECSANAFIVQMEPWANGAGVDGDVIDITLSPAADGGSGSSSVHLVATYAVGSVCGSTCHSFDVGCVTATSADGG